MRIARFLGYVIREKRGREILHQREFEILPTTCVAGRIDFAAFCDLWKMFGCYTIYLFCDCGAIYLPCTHVSGSFSEWNVLTEMVSLNHNSRDFRLFLLSLLRWHNTDSILKRFKFGKSASNKSSRSAGTQKSRHEWFRPDMWRRMPQIIFIVTEVSTVYLINSHILFQWIECENRYLKWKHVLCWKLFLFCCDTIPVARSWNNSGIYFPESCDQNGLKI